jgi:hypothetical protein
MGHMGLRAILAYTSGCISTLLRLNRPPHPPQQLFAYEIEIGNDRYVFRSDDLDDFAGADCPHERWCRRMCAVQHLHEQGALDNRCW